MRKVLFLSLLLVALTGLVAVPASADNMWLYTGSGGLGTLFQDTVNPGNFLGKGILINNLEVLDSSLNDISNGPITGNLAFGTFSGVLEITDTVSMATLFSGTISSFTMTGCGGTSCDLKLLGTSSMGWAFTGLIDGVTGSPTNGWAATSNQITATQPTPEPASLALLIPGVALVLRRKLRQ